MSTLLTDIPEVRQTVREILARKTLLAYSHPLPRIDAKLTEYGGNPVEPRGVRQVDLMIQSFEQHAGNAPYHSQLDLYDASWMARRRYKDSGTEQMFLAYGIAWGDCLRANNIDPLLEV